MTVLTYLVTVRIDDRVKLAPAALRPERIIHDMLRETLQDWVHRQPTSGITVSVGVSPIRNRE